MTLLRLRPSPSALAALLALTACVPGSLKLGDDTESGTESDSDTDTDADTGEPPPDGVLESSQVLPDIAGFDLAVAGDGSFHVVGASGYVYEGGDGGYYTHTWIGRFDPAGALLWQLAEPIEPDTFRTLFAADATPNGELYISVVGYDPVDGDGNAVRKLDPNGDDLWTVPLPTGAGAIAALPGGGVIVGGGQATGDNSGEAWAMGLSSGGNENWQRTWGDPMMRWSSIDAIAVDGDTVILGGHLGVEPLSSRGEAWLARVEAATGAPIWERSVTEAITTDTFRDLGIDGMGRIIGVGVADGPFVRAFDAAGGDLWGITPEVIGGSIGVGVDGSFVLGDGLYLPEEDPGACWGPSSPCPVAMRVVRHEADQSIRWSAQPDTCREATHVAVTPADRVLVLADCSEFPVNDVAMGLFLFAP